MTLEELAAAREQLQHFAENVFAPLVRTDQRAKGQTYLRGLLLNGARKAMQPMLNGSAWITWGCSGSSPPTRGTWPRCAA
nr:hypothetical protein [Kineococcus vitellinus]